MLFNVDLNFNIEANNIDEARVLAKEKISDMNFVNDNINVKKDDGELLTLKGYIISSLHREKIMEHLNSVGVNGDTPTGISYCTGVLINHLSKTLGDLADKGLVVCVNPQVRKGKIYRLTGLGERVVNTL